MGSGIATGRSTTLTSGQSDEPSWRYADNGWLITLGSLMAIFASATASLLDSGATHTVHPNDAGAIEGSWQPDVPGLSLGDKSVLPVYGSVEKDFIHPDGGPDLRRRVLIAPEVCGMVMSATAEVDIYGSTIVDSPQGAHIKLADGRTIGIVKAKNRLRGVDLAVRYRSASASAMVFMGIADVLLAQRVVAGSASTAICASMHPNRITVGVGKPSVLLTGMETLRLWHCRLGHPNLRSLLSILRSSGIFKAAGITAADVRAYTLEPCDFCDAFKQKRRCKLRVQWADQATRKTPSPNRALKALVRILIDVFGPVRWPSAQYGFIYLIGWWCQATGMSFVQGVKSHTATVIEGWNQRLRASLRFVVGDIDIIRTDGASEFKGGQFPEYLADSLIGSERSVAYDATQMGGIERQWGKNTPDARCLLACGDTLGKSHWYTAIRHAFFLGNVRDTRPTKAVDGSITQRSPFFRMYGHDHPLERLRTYSAPMRFVLDETQRDGKFEESARAGYYVGISPDNASAHYVWDGHAHVTVGGSCVIDETRFISRIHAPAERIDTWGTDQLDGEPPVAAPATQPTPTSKPHPRSADQRGVVLDPLPNGTRISFRWEVDASGENWDWYTGTVIKSREVSTGRLHHLLRWEGKWPTKDQEHWIYLLDSQHLWRVIEPHTPTPAPTTPVAPAPTRVQPRRGASQPSPPDSADDGDTTSPARNLRQRANMIALLFATANACAPQQRSAQSDLYHLAADIADDVDYVSEAMADADSTARGAALRAAIAADQSGDGIAFDDDVRDALRASSELYLFDFCMSEHPVLAAIKGGGAKIDRKTVVYFTSDGVATAIEPKSVKEALRSLQSDQWITAIAVEVDNLRSHSAFHLVPRSEPLSKGKKIMRLTFVFKIKVHADRSLEKFKARLCVVGTGQVQGQDFWESYSSTARTTSVKLALIVTAVEGWIDFHFDINGAFLNADIDADVYTEQAPGQEPEVGPNGEQMVWKLDKAIYGTVQAARLFRAKFRAFLLSIGFEESVDDDNVYRLEHELGRVILATHVDDGVGGASSQEVLDWLYAKIRDGGFSFSVPPGPWRSILGFGVARDLEAHSVTITCEKHILALAEEHLAADPVHLAPETPDDPTIMSLAPPPVETDEQAALLEPMRKRARSLVGALVYIRLAAARRAAATNGDATRRFAVVLL